MKRKNLETVCTTSDDSKLGLVCHYQFENGSSQFLILDIEIGSGAATLNRPLSLCTENFVQTIASSNGFILLSSHCRDQLYYIVLNLFTKDTFSIPLPCIHGRVVRVGLAVFDGCKCQFQIVLVVRVGSSESNGLELQIFSSDTSTWSKPHPINLSVLALQEFEFQELITPPLYSDGVIHWEMGNHLLAYHVTSNHCELYELPKCSEDWSWHSTMMTNHCCLCESGGYVYYCYADFDGLHVWSLLKEHDHHWFRNARYDINLTRFRWRLVHSVNHKNFNSKLQNFYHQFLEWEPYKITPIAFSDRAQIIYLQLPGSVVSYHFGTETLRSVYRYSYPDINFNCCSFLPLITSGICNQQREGNLLLTSGEIDLILPIADFEKLSL